MDILFSTVIRSAPVEKGGELIQLDWEKKIVCRQIPVIPKNPRIIDPNPRGNSRGGRGIVVLDDEIFVASYHTLEGYDFHLEPTRTIANGLLVGLHEVYRDNSGNLWVASTAIDAVIKIDTKTGELLEAKWPREDPVFSKSLNLTPLPIDKRADNRTRFLEKSHFLNPGHLHLNAVTCWEGDVYALFGSFGVIANLSKSKIIVQDESIRRGHNLIITRDGRAIVNSTRGRKTIFYRVKDGKRIGEIDLLNYPWARRILKRYSPGFFEKVVSRVSSSKTVAHPLFVRGLDIVGDCIFVGISPAAILCINYRTGELVDFFSFSDDIRVCIHGLRVVGDKKRRE